MIVVIFRKRQNSKPEMAIFDNHVKVDDILSTSKRKPLIPNKWIIDEIGVGESFIAYYEKKLKITK